MLIDWFTVAAQILNFLILVGLLKKFLYGPIIRAMDDREAKIAERMEDARREKEEAQREAGMYRKKNEEIDAKREQMMREAAEEAEKHRKLLMERVRHEVAGKKSGWLDTLAREQETFLKDLRMRAGEKVLAISRQALADLANRQMERQVVEVFLQALERTDPEWLEDPEGHEDEDERKIMVMSAFELEDDLRNQIAQKVRQWLGGPVGFEFSVSQELLSGIELRSNGQKVVWNLKEYLDSLEQSARRIFEENRSQ